MNELVTVCITTCNRKTLLIGALRSVLEQDYHNLEILIVDDASTDGTREALEESHFFKDSRVRYIRHVENKGLASSRNTAIFNSKGKYFTFCDDDDRWPADMVTKLFFAINKSDEINDTFLDCTSKLLPTVSKFIQFWNDNIEMNTEVVKTMI